MGVLVDVIVLKLPWPEGPSKFVKRTTRGQDFWPTAPSELFRDEQQPMEQEPNVGSKRACIVLSDDDTPQRPRVQVRRTVRVRRGRGGSPVASAAMGLELSDWLPQQVRDGAVQEWCNRLRDVIDLPPSSGGDDGWISGRLLMLVLRV